MSNRKIISVLAVLTIVFVTSCAKMEPLNKKGEMVSCYEVFCGTESTKALMQSNESGDPSITDPDHDEEHDKDDSFEAKED